MNSYPFRCIWCLRQSPDVSFNASHVLPECVGNAGQHVLPPGIVCESCNSYFGQKVEPALLKDPLFHVIAVFLQLVDPEDMSEFRNKLFDLEHRPVHPPVRDLKLDLNLRGLDLVLDVAYTVKGTLARHYPTKDLALLSRAIHKIAFESLAWNVFVEGSATNFDVFSAGFDVVREWARRGQPHGSVRAVLRKPEPTISANYRVRCWKFEQDVGIELMLFADWYFVSLTSTPDKVASDLVGWIGPNADERTWCIGEEISAVKTLASDSLG